MYPTFCFHFRFFALTELRLFYELTPDPVEHPVITYRKLATGKKNPTKSTPDSAYGIEMNN